MSIEHNFNQWDNLAHILKDFVTALLQKSNEVTVTYSSSGDHDPVYEIVLPDKAPQEGQKPFYLNHITLALKRIVHKDD
jgi:hypothetical protein